MLCKFSESKDVLFITLYNNSVIIISLDCSIIRKIYLVKFSWGAYKKALQVWKDGRAKIP